MRALLQVADTGPLESLAFMLEQVGVKCYLPSNRLKQELRRIGCDTVLNIADLKRGMGYEEPFPMPELCVSDLKADDLLFIDIKAHRNGPKIVNHWPNLEGKVAWYRINGGEPEHVINERGDHGNEVYPGFPILTPNQWYAGRNDAYTFWPPFYRWNQYYDQRGRKGDLYNPAVSLIHNISGWGYEILVRTLSNHGVLMFGRGSPQGVIPHTLVPQLLSEALCMVHLKSSDCPGYALYEAVAARCPVICSRRLIWRNKMEELFEDKETCLVFDQPTHAPLTFEEARKCLDEIVEGFAYLRDTTNNAEMGERAYNRLLSLMWNENNEKAIESLYQFLGTNFPSLNFPNP